MIGICARPVRTLLGHGSMACPLRVAARPAPGSLQAFEPANRSQRRREPVQDRFATWRVVQHWDQSRL